MPGKLNFTHAMGWFAHRYEAWRADPAAVISEADALAAWRGWWPGRGCPAADEAGTTCAAIQADTPTMLPESVAAACTFTAWRCLS